MIQAWSADRGRRRLEPRILPGAANVVADIAVFIGLSALRSPLGHVPLALLYSLASGVMGTVAGAAVRLWASANPNDPRISWRRLVGTAIGTLPELACGLWLYRTWRRLARHRAQGVRAA